MKLADGCCEPPPVTTGCCAEEDQSTPTGSGAKRDWLLIVCGSIIAGGYGFSCLHAWLGLNLPIVGPFTTGIFQIVNMIWWGMAIGIVMVGLLSRVPREFVVGTLGKPGPAGIARATVAGVVLDLCSHGVLMVAAKLYERGASTGQVIAFLVASPWNSFSLTMILFALVGVGWTLGFIALSMLVALTSGLAFEALVQRGRLPANPNTVDLPADFRFWSAALTGIARADWCGSAWRAMVVAGFQDSRMVMRWILLGIVLAALIRTLLDASTFAAWFGPTVGGLALTLLGATVMEVCSEGSVPIAGDLFNRAHAPGNAFAFLMAGVSTDYTEILVLRGLAGSWRFAFMLPLVTLPQIIILGLLLNLSSG